MSHSDGAWQDASLDDLCHADLFHIASSQVSAEPFRMEAGFYASEGYLALHAMQSSGFKLTNLGELSQVKWFGPFSRRYVDDLNHGIPFLSSSEMLEARPISYELISRLHTKNLDQYIVREGTVLVSRSGTVGNTTLVTKTIDGWTVSEHAIRVEALRPEDLGEIYCFLLCPVGQFLLKRAKSGSVVDSIYEADVAGLPIPRLPNNLRRELTARVNRAATLRVEASRLLEESERSICSVLELPEPAAIVGSQERHNEFSCFVVHSVDRFDRERTQGEVRLDTGFHEPLAAKLDQYLMARGDCFRLHELVKGIRNSTLRKRAYVEPGEGGIPLIGGKQMIQLRPTDFNYLSATLTKNLEAEKVQSGWTLVSSGGTLGRTAFVHRNFEGWVFSQDVMRILPDEQKVFGGYLFAFASSPYGQIQLDRRGHGSVIPRLRDFQFGSIAVPVPKDRGESVHELVIKAHDARADARQIEDSAIELFLDAVKRGRSATESDWGQEYES